MREAGGVIIIFLFFSFTSYAQTLKDTIQIETVSVSAQGGSNELEKLPLNKLSTVSTRNVGELLSRKTHLFVKSYGIGSFSTVSIRGAGSAHTNLYWNNINLNSSTNGIADLSLYPSFFLDALTINKGLSSSQLGSGGLGGSIHFHTGNDNDGSIVSIAQTLGSFGLNTTEAKLLYGKDNFSGESKFYYSVANNEFQYRDLTAEGFPTRRVQNANYLQRGFMQNLSYQMKNSRISARFWWFDSDRNLPPFITIRNNLENQKDSYLIGQLSYKRSIKGGSVQAVSSVKRSELAYHNRQAAINSNSSGVNASNLLIIKKNVGSSIQFTSRLSFDYNTVRDRSFDGEINRSIISGYGHLKFYGSESAKQFKKWNAKIALRQEYLIGEDYFFIPSLELDYQLLAKHELSLFSTIGRNVRYPTLNDLHREPFANPELRTERSNSAEFGAKITSRNPFGLALQVFSKLALFYNDIEDYILWQPTIFGYWQPVNLEAVTTSGVEFYQEFKSLKGKLSKELQLLYAYTESINENRLSLFDESEGKQLIYVPKHKVNINAQLGFKSYQLSYSYQYVSERFTSTDNFESVEAFQLSDLTLGKKITYKRHLLHLYFSVLNLWDEDYQAIQWRPMPGRNYQLKIKYELGK